MAGAKAADIVAGGAEMLVDDLDDIEHFALGGGVGMAGGQDRLVIQDQNARCMHESAHRGDDTRPQRSSAACKMVPISRS